MNYRDRYSNNPRQENPHRQQRVVQAPYSINGGWKFFKTLAGPDETAYPEESDSPTVYYAEELSSVSFSETVGAQSLIYTQTGRFKYIFNLASEDYIEEGSVVLCFPDSGQWYTIDKVKGADKVALFDILAGSNWTAPGGELVSVPFMAKLRQKDFEAIAWDGNGIPDLGGLNAGGEIATDSDGNYYKIGSIARKYDSEFNLIWEKTEGIGSSTNSNPWVNAAREIWSFYGPGGITKLDADGEILWSVGTGDLSVPVGSSIATFAVDLDGYLFIGSNFSDGVSTPSVWLSRVDPDGVEDWTVEVDSAAAQMAIQQMAVDADGNVYFTMNYEPNIRSYDNEGTLRWSRDFQTGVTQTRGSTVTHAICLDDNGDVIVGGQVTQNPNGEWGIKKISGSTQADLWSVTLTEYLWAHRLAVDSKRRVYAACNRSDSGSNNFLAGRQYSKDGLLIGSDFPNQQVLYLAVAPGRYPHFLEG